MKKRKGFIIKDNEISQLFDKFSYPITKSATDDLQKEKAISIAKLLWLPFVKSLDSEQNIYNLLSQIESIDHQGKLSIGSLYFHKMKKALSTVEILRLQNHYKSAENFNKLKEWNKQLK
jgi:hypothetical protein